MLRVVVSVAPSPFRQEWLSFLRSVSSLEVVEIVDSLADLPAAVRIFRPALTILDCGLISEACFDTLRQVKQFDPQCGCLVLVDNLLQMQQARQAGADWALLRGFSADEFFHVLKGVSRPVPGLAENSPLCG